MVSMRSLLAYFWVDKTRVLFFVFCCVLVLFLAWKQRNHFAVRLRRYLVVPSIVLLAFLLNPLVAHLLVTLDDETRSLRFFWLVPVSLLLAIVTVYLISFLPGRRQKILIAAVVPFVLLAFSNQFSTLRHTWQNRVTNAYKVPEVVIALDDWIMNDDAGLEKTAVFPTPLNLWVRQYRAEIKLPYAWWRINRKSEAAGNLYDIIEATDGPVDLDQVNEWAVKGGYNYIVLDSGETYQNILHNYQEVYRIDVDPTKDTNSYDREYIVYRLIEEGVRG